MRLFFQMLGLAAVAIGAAVAVDGSGYIGDPGMFSAPSWWMYGGLFVSLAGAAVIFAARGSN